MDTTITRVADGWRDSHTKAFVTVASGKEFPVYNADVKALAERCWRDKLHVRIKLIGPITGGPTYIQRIQIIDGPKEPA